MNLITFTNKQISDDPSLIEGLVLQCIDSEARTKTYRVPESKPIEVAPVEHPKPKTEGAFKAGDWITLDHPKPKAKGKNA